MLDKEDYERMKSKLVENQHEKIQGYRDLTEKEINTVNDIKDLEREFSDLWKNIKDSSILQADPRWLAVAKTNIQQGFMALTRAVTKPNDPFEYDDDEDEDSEA